MQKTEAPTMAVRYALKQPEGKCPEEPRWKRMDLLLLWEGGASAAPHPPAPCLIYKEPHWRRDCPLRCRSQGSDSQDNRD